MSRESRLVLVAVAFLLACLVPSVHAQERVYLGQGAPAVYHAFSFSGGIWTREDMRPGHPDTSLPGGLEPYGGLAATDRLLIAGGTSGLSFDAVDPFTGVELPRVSTTVTFGKPHLSADQQWGYTAGDSAASVAHVSVADLRPSSPQFLTQVGSVAIPGGNVGSSALDGTTLWLALNDSNGSAGFAPAFRLIAVDVSAPAAPAVVPGSELLVTPALAPMPANNAAIPQLRVFDLGGTRYLFVCRRDLYVFEIGPGATLTLRGQYGSSRAGFRRQARDAYAAMVGANRRAWVATDAGNFEEMLLLDLDTFTNDGAGASILGSKTFRASGTAGDDERLSGSLDGTHVYLLSPGNTPTDPAELFAIPVGPLSEVTVAPSVTIVAPPSPALSMLVRDALTAAPGPSITAVAVQGALTPNVLVNDTPRTLRVSGSGLTGTTHVFVGLNRAGSPSVVDDGTVDAATVGLDPLSPTTGIPAGNPPVVVVTAAGGIAAFPAIDEVQPGRLAVVNSPTYVPPHRAYASGNGDNLVSIVNSASETQVGTRFASAAGAGRANVTPDGKLLLVSGFRAGEVAVHALAEDSGLGWDFHELVASIYTGGAPQAMALTPDGRRLYVTTLNGTVAMIDAEARPPVQIDTDDNSGTTDDHLDTGLHPEVAGITQISYLHPTPGPGNFDARGLALSPDGQWLYVARSRDPHIAIVHVDDDVVMPGDVTFYSIPSPPPNAVRADGIAVVGSKLYFTSAGDPAMLRVFDVSGASIAPASPATIPMPASAAPGVRQLRALPDGRFLYAASRAAGPTGRTAHVLDLATHTWVAEFSLGTFSDLPGPAPTSDVVYVGTSEFDTVFTIDARPGPGIHRVIGAAVASKGTGGVAVSPGLETPPGTNVEVVPAPGVTLEFAGVGSAGNTTVTSTNATEVTVPEGFTVIGFGGNPVFYEISTTATFTPPVKVCLSYTDEQVFSLDEATLRLMHEEGGTFVDRTIGAPDTDPAQNRICGQVSSFSQFAIVIRTGERTLCSTLGRERQGHGAHGHGRHGHGQDTDVFEFQGTRHESVTIVVSESGDDCDNGRVKLRLEDRVRRARLVEHEKGELPLEIAATLPKSGRYLIDLSTVGRHGYRGGYCLTLRSSGEAFATLVPARSVEP